MVFIARQEPFECEHCKEMIQPLESGSYRNHCPHCLYSKHVDDKGPGDRASTCGGLMKPIGIDQRSGRFIVIHKCQKCDKQIPNRAAADDDLASFSMEIP